MEKSIFGKVSKLAIELRMFLQFSRIAKKKKKRRRREILLWHSQLRIWHCHCGGLSRCCYMGSVPGPGTSSRCRCAPPQKKQMKKNMPHRPHPTKPAMFMSFYLCSRAPAYQFVSLGGTRTCPFVPVHLGCPGTNHPGCRSYRGEPASGGWPGPTTQPPPSCRLQSNLVSHPL